MAADLRTLEGLLRRLQDRPQGGPGEEESCALPAGHTCSGGWHRRDDGGRGTCYERCPQALATRAESRAAALPGTQTFENFERLREPAAYQATRRWVEACAQGTARLALIRADDTAANTGCGKSHLLRAGARELTRRGRWVELVNGRNLSLVVRGRALFDQYERAASDIDVKRWAACEVLLLDDLGQEETAGPVTSAFLVGLLDQRGEGSSLAFASNLSERELAGRYGVALVSRLLSNAEIPRMQGMDYRRKVGRSI